MYPLVFGGYSTYTLTLVVMAIIPVAFLVTVLKREGVRTVRVWSALLVLLVVAVLGAKVFSLATRGWPLPVWSEQELSAGLRFSGAVIGLLLVLPVVQRLFLSAISLARAADIIGMTLALAVCSGRVACLLAGCCTGGRGDSPLHFSYPPGSAIWYRQLHSGVIESSHQWSEPVLALPILFFLASLFAVVFLLRFDPHRRYDGQVCLLFLAVHELPKFLLELLREPLVSGQVAATAIAGTVGLLGLVFFYYRPPASSPHEARYHS